MQGKWIATGALVVLLVGAGGFALGRATAPAESAAQEATGKAWLFTTTAAAGTMTENTDGTYALVLTDVDRTATAFTDRPDRDAAIIPLRALVAAWPSVFEDSDPNGVLAVEMPSGDTVSLVLELKDPVMDGTMATFTATVVDTRQRVADLAGLNEAEAAAPPEQFGAANLFIDDASSKCHPAVSNQPEPGSEIGCWTPRTY